jgi:hypothetical protein
MISALGIGEDLHMTWWKIALLVWLAAAALVLWFLHRSKRNHV